MTDASPSGRRPRARQMPYTVRRFDRVHAGDLPRVLPRWTPAVDAGGYRPVLVGYGRAPEHPRGPQTVTDYEFEKSPPFPGTGNWGCPAYHFSAVDGSVVVSGGSHVYDGAAADLVVRVATSQRERWVGYFASGMGGATSVIPSPDPGQLLVVAAGEPYLVPAARPEETTLASDGMPIRTVVELRPVRVLLVSDLDITALGASGVEWRTNRLCVDDLAISRIENGVIHCTGWFGESAEYGHDSILLSAATGEHVGGRQLPDVFR